MIFEQLLLDGSPPEQRRPPQSGTISVRWNQTLGRLEAVDYTDSEVPLGNGTPQPGTPVKGVKATGTLTGDSTNVTNGDTVTIGSKVYTFQSTLTNVDGHVKIGGSAAATLTNLFRAINASGGTPGTDYAAATVANTQVVATNPTGTTVVVTALAAGTAYNSVATTEASTHLSWGAATLTGGVNSTTAVAGDQYYDASFLYTATTDMTIESTTGWVKSSVSAL